MHVFILIHVVFTRVCIYVKISYMCSSCINLLQSSPCPVMLYLCAETVKFVWVGLIPLDRANSYSFLKTPHTYITSGKPSLTPKLG